MKSLFLAIMMYYNNGDLNADHGVPHYGSFTVLGTRHCDFNEDGSIKSCDDKEINGYVTYSLEDSSVVINLDDYYKDYEIKYVKYDDDGSWLIITKTQGNRDYWCFNFNIDTKQVMLSQVRRNKVVYEGCLMFYFGNYIIG